MSVMLDVYVMHALPRLLSGLWLSQAGPINCAAAVSPSWYLASAPSPLSPPLQPKTMAKPVSREGIGAYRAALVGQNRGGTRP